MKKYTNWLTALAVVLLLAGALTIRFSPEENFKNALLNLAELPRNLFRFSWTRQAREEPTEMTEATEPEEKEQTPFVPFDKMEEPSDTPFPTYTLPAEGMDVLPEDVLIQSAE